MEASGFRLHYRAFVVLSQLPEADQAAIRERLASIANLPPSEWPARWSGDRTWPSHST